MFFNFITCTVAISFLLLCNSCKKDELTKPVDVQFQFKLDREPDENAHSSFSSGQMGIESIFLTGDREKGEDISFTSDFAATIDANLGTGVATPPVNFDLPQGVYKRIDIVVTLDSPIIINGEYIQASPFVANTPVKLEINLTDLAVIVEAENGSQDILLNRNNDATIDVYLNPADWFGLISSVALDNAVLQQIKGISSIVISSNSNPDIYNHLLSEIPNAIQAVVK